MPILIAILFSILSLSTPLESMNAHANQSMQNYQSQSHHHDKTPSKHHKSADSETEEESEEEEEESESKEKFKSFYSASFKLNKKTLKTLLSKYYSEPEIDSYKRPPRF